MKTVSIIAALGAAGAAASAAWGHARRRARRGTGQDEGQLAGVVADALSAEWAALTVTDPQLVRDALLYGEPPALCRELAALVADVEVTFSLVGPGAVPVVITCAYADSRLTTVRQEIPWEQVPDGERAKFLRKGCRSLSRHWTPPAGGPVSSGAGTVHKARLTVI
jgi:hypothetical protein